MPLTPSANRAVAYSYVRFSHPDQIKGDSLRRQTEAAAAWCQRNGVRLDESVTLHDLGKSAYTGEHRKNPDRHALAAFLKLVETGKVPRGSYLLIENLDRLSREHIQPALLLSLNLLQAGIRVVQLKPSEIVFDEQSDTLPVMMMMMELSRGHGESAIKSQRVGEAWDQKRKAARESGKVITHKLPAWVEESNGKLVLIPERAAVVKHIFQLAIAGYGQPSIIRRLTDDQVPGFGYRQCWTRTYIGKLLKDRRALGEWQPLKGGKPDGPPIPNYFPAAVTEKEWNAAMAGVAQRFTHRGRTGKNVINPFAGMLWDARDGGAYYMASRTLRYPDGKRVKYPMLLNRNVLEGTGTGAAFPFAVFEAAVLSLLREVNPREILNGDSAPDETMALSGELARVEGKIAELETELLTGEVAALARVLRQLENRKRDLAERLTEARMKAAHPLSETWGEARTLMETLETAPDPEDTRLRLRSALRRMIEGIWVLVIPRRRTRLVAVQIGFAGGVRRDYLVYYQPPLANASARRKSVAHACSLNDVATLGKVDLRKRADTERLTRFLAEMDLGGLLAEMNLSKL